MKDDAAQFVVEPGVDCCVSCFPAVVPLDPGGVCPRCHARKPEPRVVGKMVVTSVDRETGVVTVKEVKEG